MLFSIGQGFRNIGRNLRLSFASVMTISACIFLFCLFFAVGSNIKALVTNIETKVGITVFFDEDLSETQIREIGRQIEGRAEVRELHFTSAQEAWEHFKAEYFEGNEALAEGFADDNPLSGSASYTVFLNDIEKQPGFIDWLNGVNGVRQVNYSSGAAASLTSINRLISLVFGAIILILLGVSVFLISNTVAVAAAFRRNEMAIMRLVGATNTMIRAPFVIEGVVLGLIGSVIPLAIICWLYEYASAYFAEHFGLLSDVLAFLPIGSLFPRMAGASLALGAGIGLVASILSIRKNLKV